MVHLIDSVDLHGVSIYAAPSEIANWPITVNITAIEMSPEKGFRIEFDQALPDAWKFPTNPTVPSENYQYSVWIGVPVNGSFHASAFVQMWQGRPSTGGFEFGSFAADWSRNYVYAERWGAMRLYEPKVGDQILIFVSAGNARGEAGMTSVRERSNAVLFNLPPGDRIVTNYGVIETVPMNPLPSPPAVTFPPTADFTALLAQFKTELDVELAAAFTAQHDFIQAQSDRIVKKLDDAAKQIAGANLAGLFGKR